MRKLLTFIIICLVFNVGAQPGVANVVEIGGKKFYQHKVEEGNTLWGMQQMYGVPYQEIVDANPGFSGLKKGEIVLVPFKGGAVEKEVKTSDYRVKNGETLYGLSKKFNTTVDELIVLNPELKDGLKKNQTIKVPGDVPQDVAVEEPVIISTPNPFVVDTIETDHGFEKVVVSFSDSTVRHVVMAHETMYSISKRFMVPIADIMKINGLQSTNVKEGQILIIPVKSERVDNVGIKSIDGAYDSQGSGPLAFEKKSEYNIALLLPLHLDYGGDYSENISNLAAQFYMGSTLALENLERKGLRAKVHVYDTKNDSNSVKAVLAKPEFASMDLVIGPLLGNGMKPVARYCKEHMVRMVCPVAADKELLENNRLIYASVPSDVSLMAGMAKFLLENHASENVILVKPLDEASLPLYEAFKKAFLEIKVSGVRPNLVETTVSDFGGRIIKGKKNHLIVPTAHRTTAVKFMNSLNHVASGFRKDDIQVYGMSEWVNFTEVNDLYKNKYNFHYVSPNFLDYYTDEMIEMNRLYRTKYKTDMSKVAVQAYDVLTYYCSSFYLGNEKPVLLMNDIWMSQKTEADGFENSNAFVIEQEDYELILVGTSANGVVSDK